MNLNRRFDVTGLEEPEELWERLKDANEQIRALGASNKRLSARVALLERQLSEVGGLTDDELIAELPRRMAKALESAQGVASEVIRRANQREVMIRQQASAAAHELRKHAEVDAAEIRRRAAADAAAVLAAAETESQKILGAARARRDDVLLALREQSSDYEHQIGLLREHHAQLAGAFDVVERTLAEARSSLRDDFDSATAPISPDVDTLPPHDRAARKLAKVGQDATPAEPPTAPQSDGHIAVYDWSPVDSHVG